MSRFCFPKLGFFYGGFPLSVGAVAIGYSFFLKKGFYALLLASGLPVEEILVYRSGYFSMV